MDGVRHIDIYETDLDVIRKKHEAIVVEAPLEIRIGRKGGKHVRLGVTMRTPGDDILLAKGFIYTEGVIQTIDEIHDIKVHEDHLLVTLSDQCEFDLDTISERLLISSSCGICGKKGIKELEYQTSRLPWFNKTKISLGTLSQMPAKMRFAQTLFEATGGIHAAALFDQGGHLISIKEDVGRHNALDKLIGDVVDRIKHPTVVFVSGRTSYELVQKTAMLGAPILASVGPASSLAIETAEAEGMTLIGFASDVKCNVYTGWERIL